MPTTVTETIGADAGRDFSTVGGWWAALPADLTAVDEVRIGEHYNDNGGAEFTYTSQVTFSGKGSDATRYPHLTAAAGESFIDNIDLGTDPLIYDPALGVGLKFNYQWGSGLNLHDAFIRVSRLQLRKTWPGNSRVLDFEAGGNSNRVFDCMVEGNTDAGVPAIYAYSSELFYRCLVVQKGLGYAIDLGGASRAYGCTVIGTNAGHASTGVRSSYPNSPVLQNCVVAGFGSAIQSISWHAASDHNATDDTSAPGANSLDNIVLADNFEDVVADPYDLRLKSGNVLAGAGLADPTYNPVDLFGTVRADPPTIGAQEWAAVGGDVFAAATAAGAGAAEAGAALDLAGAGTAAGAAAAEATAVLDLAAAALAGGAGTAEAAGVLDLAAAASAAGAGGATAAATVIGNDFALTGSIRARPAIGGMAAARAAVTATPAARAAVSGQPRARVA